jgi:hypothetical protein
MGVPREAHDGHAEDVKKIEGFRETSALESDAGKRRPSRNAGLPRIQDVETGRPLRSRIAQRLNGRRSFSE